MLEAAAKAMGLPVTTVYDDDFDFEQQDSYQEMIEAFSPAFRDGTGDVRMESLCTMEFNSDDEISIEEPSDDDERSLVMSEDEESSSDSEDDEEIFIDREDEETSDDGSGGETIAVIRFSIGGGGG